jgi:hypothetical protein
MPLTGRCKALTRGLRVMKQDASWRASRLRNNPAKWRWSNIAWAHRAA